MYAIGAFSVKEKNLNKAYGRCISKIKFLKYLLGLWNTSLRCGNGLGHTVILLHRVGFILVSFFRRDKGWKYQKTLIFPLWARVSEQTNVRCPVYTYSASWILWWKKYSELKLSWFSSNYTSVKANSDLNKNEFD